MTGKNALPYYKRYPRDFLEGSAGMGFELKTAYAFVLDLIYLHNGQCPDDPKYVSGQLECSVRMWKSIRKRLIERGKIFVSGEVFGNSRAIFELEKLARYSEKQSKVASMRGKSTTYENSGNANQNQNQNQKSKSTTGVVHRARERSKLMPADVLRAVLDEEHVAAVLEHRRFTIKRPLTPHSAKLLANAFKEWPDPNQAADIMIEACWQGFKAEWAKNRVEKSGGGLAPRSGGGAASRPARSVAGMAMEMVMEMERREREAATTETYNGVTIDV